MVDYEKYIYALRKCAKEHESERTLHGQIIVSDICRDTANLLEELKQEPTINKIKAEIIEKSIVDCELHGCGTSDLLIDTSEALAIIDKYTAGSEG